jgi:hypothetical protein
MEASNFKFYIACVLEGDGDSEPEDTRPTSFRKAGSESSAIETKIIKVSSDLFVYGVCSINSLNTELNPICHLPALLEAHHILHVSRIRFNTGMSQHERIDPVI